MSEYNSNLLFGTQVSYEDNNENTFEGFSNEPIESNNPFLAPQQNQQQEQPSYPQVQQQYTKERIPTSQPPSYNPPQPTPQQQQQQQQQTNNNGTTVQQKQRTSQNYQQQASNNSNFQSNFKPTFTTPTNQFISNSRTSMDITVNFPDMVGEGMGAYAIYKIVTKSALNENPDYKKEVSVNRRYSDFLWLRNALKETRKGCIIPQLPEKAVLNNRNKEFLEQRRRDLEKFLNRVVESNSLAQSNEVATFLEGSDEQLSSAKQSRPDQSNMESSTMSPPPQEGGKMGKISSFFGNSITTLTQGVHSVKEIDGWFGDKKSYILQLDSTLHRLEDTISNVIKKRRELAVAMGDLTSAGLSFSSCEIPVRQDIANGYQRLTEVESNIRQGMEDLSNNEQGYFEEGIRDYLRAISSVKELLNDRLDALMAMQNNERVVAAKKEKAAKTSGAKAATMQKEVDDAIRKLTEATTEYEKISASARLELTKFDEKRAYEMKRILNYVIRLNLDHFLKSSDCWRELLTEQHSNGDPNFDTKNKASWGSTTI
ncbi:hypothetical protein RB653_010263 [Dictyostelium firmibasis]|uniref:PX domain-containing protein n=1 Tax=Dictyostelium firmibasis TaxID=79012 RepID=A0AAN7TTH2_9MYCE